MQRMPPFQAPQHPRCFSMKNQPLWHLSKLNKSEHLTSLLFLVFKLYNPPSVKPSTQLSSSVEGNLSSIDQRSYPQTSIPKLKVTSFTEDSKHSKHDHHSNRKLYLVNIVMNNFRSIFVSCKVQLLTGYDDMIDFIFYYLQGIEMLSLGSFKTGAILLVRCGTLDLVISY